MTENDRGDRPALSVVVASFSGDAALANCLESISAQPTPAEVLVVSNAAALDVAGYEKRYPSVRFVRGSPDANVFQLRALGVHQARGRMIALTEDHCTVSSGWLAAFIVAHDEGHGIVGGPVDNGLDRRAYDWALYFSEYGLYLPPQPDGPTGALSGLNIAYDRELLMNCSEAWAQSFRENEINDLLRKCGHRPFLLSDAEVQSHLKMTLWEAMVHLFDGGRHFGTYRRRRLPAALQALRIVSSPAVPFVLFGRLVGRLWSRNPRRLLTLCRSLPYLLCLLGTWSAGEAVGYMPRRTASRGANQPRGT